MKNIFLQGLLMVLWSPMVLANLAHLEQGANEMSEKAKLSETSLNFNEIEFWQGEDTLEYQAVLAQLKNADVVIVGEYHDQWSSHLLQEQLLKDLSLQGKWAVGAEWLPVTTQEAVDRFLKGELSHFEFIRASGYVNHWGFDYRLVKPVFGFARAANLPFIALNAPRKVTKKISNDGLEALTEDEKQMFPNPLYPMSEKYEKFTRDFFESNQLPADRIERMLIIQSVWDQTMAKSVAEFLNAHPGSKMMVFAGMVHAGKGAGIEDTLREILPNKKIVTLGNGGFDDFEEDGFDYFASLSDVNLGQLPELPSLGLLLESGNDGVVVEGVQPGSIASHIGLKSGDRIWELDGVELHNFSDLKAAMWLLDVAEKTTLKWHSKDDLLDIPLNKQAEVDFQK